MIEPTDPMEKIIFRALQDADIVFAMGDSPHNKHGLDFYLIAYDVYIEVKQMHSPRIAEQMSRAENVIAVQGASAVVWLARQIREAGAPR